MPLSDLPPEDCLRAREQISLHLDSELSELDRALLEVHLACCSSCAVYNAELTALTAALRTTPVQAPAVKLPAAPRRRARFTVHPAAAAAAMAFAAFTIGGLVNLTPSPYHQAAVDLRTSRELISVKERQMEALQGALDKARTLGPTGNDPTTGTIERPTRASFSGIRAQAAWR
jgi:anti-sigma factor RsiW